MARLTDHDVRDAEHAARLETAGILGLFARRINERSKALIQEAIEANQAAGIEDFDGRVIGREAAQRAAAVYFPNLVPPHLIEQGDDEEPEDDLPQIGG